MKRQKPEVASEELIFWMRQYLQLDPRPVAQPWPAPPDWVCHSEEDQAKLKNWTIDRLRQEEDESTVPPPSPGLADQYFYDRLEIAEALEEAASSKNPEPLLQLGREYP